MLSFDPSTHSYWSDTRRLSSVTEILRMTGIYSNFSFAESHHKYRGTAVHTWCAITDLGGTPVLGPVPPHLKQVGEEITNGYWPAFSRFKERTGWQGRIWEASFIDPLRGFAGTLDTVGEMGDDICLLDVKSGVMPELVPAQLALYWLLVTKGLPVHPDHPGMDWLMEVVKSGRPVKRVALRLEKSGKDTLFTQTSKGEDFSSPKWIAVANSVLNLYTVRQQYNLLEKEAR